jgi:hypothetical protein
MFLKGSMNYRIRDLIDEKRFFAMQKIDLPKLAAPNFFDEL